MVEEDFKRVIVNHGCEPMFGEGNEDLVWSHPYLPIIFMFDPFKMHVQGMRDDIMPKSSEWLDDVLTLLEVMTT